jgi:hypothetical protein
MIYRVVYKSGKLSCIITDHKTAVLFASYLPKQPDYPVLILKLKKLSN